MASRLFLAQMGTCCLLSENDASKRVCVLFVAVKITKLAIAQITKTTPRHKAAPLPPRTTPTSQCHPTQPQVRRLRRKTEGQPLQHVRGVLHPARARAYCLGRGSQTERDTLFKFIVYPFVIETCLKIVTLVDSGSSHSFMDIAFAQNNKIPTCRLPTPV